MFSLSEALICRWRPSPWLLRLYLAVLSLALLAPWCSDIPYAFAIAFNALTAVYGLWVAARQVRLSHKEAWCGVSHDARGWQVYSRAGGWQPVTLRPDSLALPALIVLRFTLAGRRRVYSACIARDSLEPALHRRLRVRLKFARRRFSPPVEVG